MNSNEMFWMHSAFRRKGPPAIRMHTSVSYTDRGYLVRMCMLIPQVSVQTFRISHIVNVQSKKLCETTQTCILLRPGTHSTNS